MAKASKIQAKLAKARMKADEDTELARARAERKIAKARAQLTAAEAKIQARLQKALRKADAKLAHTRGANRTRAAGKLPSKNGRGRQRRAAES